MRPWLYRVAHNRCIDYARRAPATPLQPDELLPGGIDPVVEAERREELRRLVADLHALPAPQRSALIIRELEGLSYAELSTALGVTVPAVKSLLVRARTGLVEVAEARDTDCAVIRDELALAVDRPGRPPRLLRDHLRQCSSCRAHRQALRHGHAQLASLLPGPSSLLLGGWLATLFGSGGGATSAAAGSSLAVGATKALAVASASFAVAGGAARVAERAHPPARHPHAVTAATPAPRVPLHTVAAPPPPVPIRPAPRPRAVQMIEVSRTPGRVPSAPAVEKRDEPEPTPTPTPTASPTPTATSTPAPDETATATPEPAAETATEATATPSP